MTEPRTPAQIAAEDYPYSAGAAAEKDWAAAEPWRRLASDAGVQPGGEIIIAVGPVTGPFLVKSLVAMPYSLAGARVEIVLNGKFRLIDDGRFDVERTLALPRFLMLPGVLMQVNVKNAGSEPGAFRALICGENITPRQALDFYISHGYDSVYATTSAYLARVAADAMPKREEP